MLTKISLLLVVLMMSAAPEKKESLDNGDYFDHTFDENTILCISNGTCYSKKDFAAACEKSNIQKDKDEYRKFYLLYVLMRLKVVQAMELKMDQTEAFRTEWTGYAKQVKRSYKNKTDEEIEKDESYQRLMREYFDGILIYELTNTKIWSRSHQNHPEVKAYFEKHPEKYPNAVFEEIKITVAADYQNELMENWEQELKATYAYRTNKEVYETVFEGLGR